LVCKYFIIKGADVLSSEQAYIFGLLHDKEINAKYYFSDYGDKVAT